VSKSRSSDAIDALNAAIDTVTITNDMGLDSGNTVFQWNGVEMTENYPTKTDFDVLKETTEKRLSAIEDQVLIIRRDNALEEDYEELKKAWEAYEELRERLRTFKALKDSA